MASKIIRSTLAPKFKEAKLYEGLDATVKAIKKLIEDNRSVVGQNP